MDSKDVVGLMEAYSQVYAPQEVDEESKEPDPFGRPGGKYGGVPKKGSEYDRYYKANMKAVEKLDKKSAKYEEFDSYDIYDEILEFLQSEGYAETFEQAEWIMANLIDEEAIDIILGEEQLNEISNRKVAAVGRRRQANVDRAMTSDDYISDKPGATQKLATNISKLNKFKYLEKKRNKNTTKESFEDWIDEAMTNYEKNRKRAAQRAAARNEARKQGKTGAVPGVGYVSPRKERETWTDERGRTKHAKGL